MGLRDKIVQKIDWHAAELDPRDEHRHAKKRSLRQ